MSTKANKKLQIRAKNSKFQKFKRAFYNYDTKHYRGPAISFAVGAATLVAAGGLAAAAPYTGGASLIPIAVLLAKFGGASIGAGVLGAAGRRVFDKYIYKHIQNTRNLLKAIDASHIATASAIVALVTAAALVPPVAIPLGATALALSVAAVISYAASSSAAAKEHAKYSNRISDLNLSINHLRQSRLNAIGLGKNLQKNSTKSDKFGKTIQLGSTALATAATGASVATEIAGTPKKIAEIIPPIAAAASFIKAITNAAYNHRFNVRSKKNICNLHNEFLKEYGVVDGNSDRIGRARQQRLGLISPLVDNAILSIAKAPPEKNYLNQEVSFSMKQALLDERFTTLELQKNSAKIQKIILNFTEQLAEKDKSGAILLKNHCLNFSKFALGDIGAGNKYTIDKSGGHQAEAAETLRKLVMHEVTKTVKGDALVTAVENVARNVASSLNIDVSSSNAKKSLLFSLEQTVFLILKKEGDNKIFDQNFCYNLQSGLETSLKEYLRPENGKMVLDKEVMEQFHDPEIRPKPTSGVTNFSMNMLVDELVMANSLPSYQEIDTEKASAYQKTPSQEAPSNTAKAPISYSTEEKSNLLGG